MTEFPGDFSKILEQFQSVQENVSKMKEEMQQKEIEASSGGGMVTVRVNGAFDLTDIKIDPTVANADDIEMLQDLVKAAVNEGMRQAKDIAKGELSKITGGFPIPGL